MELLPVFDFQDVIKSITIFLHNSVHLFGCSSCISCYLVQDLYVIKIFSLGHILH